MVAIANQKAEDSSQRSEGVDSKEQSSAMPHNFFDDPPTG
jgi:hypothetical protein